jgi:hypothetical protein
MSDVRYIWLKSGDAMPRAEMPAPFKAVILIEDDVTPEWRDFVSEWLVHSGCLYAMAWGRECSLWDDSIDHASIMRFADCVVPENQSVMTTWHDAEPMGELMRFARWDAIHQTEDLPTTVFVDIVPAPRERLVMETYEASAERDC